MSNVGRTPIVVNPQTGYPADTGCEVSPSCLECPLPQCKYDDLLWYQDWKQRQKDVPVVARARELETRSTGGIAVVAKEFGITERTVYRVLKRSK